MPRWNLGEIMSDVTARIGRRVDMPKSVVSRYANQAYQDITNIARPMQLERIAISSTTSGENRLELPPDFFEPISLSYLTNIGSARTLRPTNVEELDAVGFTPVGISDRYALYGKWLELWPSPNSAYSMQLRYRSYSTTLTSGQDIPSVSTEWRFPIVLRTEMYLHQWLGDPERAAGAQNAYAAHVATLETDLAHRQRDHTGMRVRVIW